MSGRARLREPGYGASTPARAWPLDTLAGGRLVVDTVAGATWIRMLTIGPVPRQAATFDVLLGPESGGRYIRTLNTAPFSSLRGLLFLADGYVSAAAPVQDYGQPWDVGPQVVDGTTLPSFTVCVTRLAVWWPDAPLRAERLWYPGARAADTIEQLGPATPDDTERAAAAQAALFRFSERIARRGKRKGDGATWAGGTPDFLDDLWATLEAQITASGTHFGHDPTSRQFRSKMRESPSERTIRTWLGRAELRPDDVKSGRVTRANYRQFVAK